MEKIQRNRTAENLTTKVLTADREAPSPTSPKRLQAAANRTWSNTITQLVPGGGLHCFSFADSHLHQAESRRSSKVSPDSFLYVYGSAASDSIQMRACSRKRCKQMITNHSHAQLCSHTLTVRKCQCISQTSLYCRWRLSATLPDCTFDTSTKDQ
jgi:hypothetical protein